MKKNLVFVFTMLFAATTFGQKSGTNSDVINNAIYARIAYGYPGGTLKSEGVLTAGAQFEVGTVFYINKLSLPDELKLGVDVTYMSISGMVNKDNLVNNNQTNSYFTAGVKVGPCLSYNFAGKWIADLYFKLHPHYFITGEQNQYDAATQLKFGTSMGLNIRYRALMLGCEFTSARYDFDVAETASRALQASTSQSIKLPATFLSIGVNF